MSHIVYDFLADSLFFDKKALKTILKMKQTAGWKRS
jgi:hypothetical protein